MFVRLWWFAVGVGAGVWGAFRLLDGARRARRQLTPQVLIRQAGLGVADVLDRTAVRFEGSSMTGIRSRSQTDAR